MSTQSAAIKIAKELGVKYSKKKEASKYWSDLLSYVTAKKNHNQVVQSIAANKDEILHKRSMQNVLLGIKHTDPKGEDFDIPVLKTDPPTIDAAALSDKLRGIVIGDFTMAFSVTSVVETRDENNVLLGSQERVSAFEQIKHTDFNKRVVKNPSGALAGFFNQYMLKLNKSLAFVRGIRLILTKKINTQKKLTPNFDSMQMNCLMQVVDTALAKRKNYATELAPLILMLSNKYKISGVAEDAIDEVCKVLKINVRVVSILQQTWYHKHTGDTRLTVLVCSNNGHATVYKPKKIDDFLDRSSKIISCTYFEGGMIEHFLANKCPIKFPVLINDKLVAYFEPDGTMYKSMDMFFDEADFIANKNNKDLYNVFTSTSRFYRDLRTKYDLQDKWADPHLYHFVRCADVYTSPWCTDEKFAQPGYGVAFDQTRAYMFYEKSKYYDKYEFPRQPTHFYDVNVALHGADSTMQQQLLQLSGFAQVANVCIPKHLVYIRKTQMIQNDCVYTTLRLNWLSELGVTFDIKRIAFANDKQKIDFHVNIGEWHQAQEICAKQAECSLMGRLIPNTSNAMTSLVHCRDENEFLQLRFQLGSRVMHIDWDLKIIHYSEEANESLRGIYHVHAFILDYQQIEFATKAMSVPFEHILKVKVDCIVLRSKHYENNSDWQLTRACEKDHPVRWIGFHPENTIKDCKTQHISEVDFTHRKYTSLVQLSELPEIALHRNNEVTGAAGTTKTYTVTHLLLYDVCMLVPTCALAVKIKQENPNMPVMTYHRAFEINAIEGQEHYGVRRYSNYIMDECSMICKGVMNKCLTHKFAKNANIILVHDRAQLSPLLPDNSKWESPEQRYFTNGTEYKARKWNLLHLTKQMRQNDPEFINILTQMRTLQDSKNGGLAEMVALLKHRIVKESDLITLYRFDTNDIVIASTNVVVDRYNKILLKMAKKGQIKAKYNRTIPGKYANNERVILQTELGTNMELAFASTVHIVQGITFSDRLFVSLSVLDKKNNFDQHLFYTAVSRVKSIEQLYLLSS